MTPTQAKALLAALPRAVAATIMPALDDATARVAEEARLLATPQQSGSRHRRGHAAGTLAGSISTGRDPDTDAAVVTVAAPYATDVEYGTMRMAARPYLRPAVEQVAPDIRDRLAADLNQAVADMLDAP